MGFMMPLLPLISTIIGAAGTGYAASVTGKQQESALAEQRKQAERQYQLQRSQAEYLLSPQYRASQDQFIYGTRPTTGGISYPTNQQTSMLGYGAEDTNFIPGAYDLLKNNPYGNQNVYSWI